MRKIPAAFLVVFLVVPLFLAALYTIAVSTWVLDREFYRSLLSDPGLYEGPVSRGQMEWIARRTGTPELAAVPAAAFARALREAFPPSAVRDQASRLLDEAGDFFQGLSPSFDPTLDLTGLKATLAGDGGRRFAAALASGLPACPPGAAAARPGTFPACRASDAAEDRTAEVIMAALPAFLSRIPDRIRLLEEPLSRRWTRGARWPAPGWIGPRALAAADFVLLLLACAAWVGAAFLGGASARERLLWLGWSLAPAALAVFLTGLGMSLPFVARSVRFALAEASFETAGFGVDFLEAVYAAARAAIGRISTGFLGAGAIAGGLAVGLVAWGCGTRRPAAEEAPKAG